MTLLNDPRRMRFRVISATQHSTRLSQEQLVGIKYKILDLRIRRAMQNKNCRPVVTSIGAGAKTVRDQVFGFGVVTECPGVPREILLPRES